MTQYVYNIGMRSCSPAPTIAGTPRPAQSPGMFLKAGNGKGRRCLEEMGLSPACSDSPFRSPPTSVPRGNSFNEIQLQRIKSERELMQTPKATDSVIRDLCRGAAFVKPPKTLDVLSKVLPVVIFLSLVLLFVFPPCAAVFVGALAWYAYVRRAIKRHIEIGEKNRPVPKFVCPTPRNNMLW